MGKALQLRVSDYQDINRRRWELSDQRGNFIADHEVSLDSSAFEYRGYLDLPIFPDFFFNTGMPMAARFKGKESSCVNLGPGLVKECLEGCLKRSWKTYVILPPSCRS